MACKSLASLFLLLIAVDSYRLEFKDHDSSEHNVPIHSEHTYSRHSLIEEHTGVVAATGRTTDDSAGGSEMSIHGVVLFGVAGATVANAFSLQSSLHTMHRSSQLGLQNVDAVRTETVRATPQNFNANWPNPTIPGMSVEELQQFMAANLLTTADEAEVLVTQASVAAAAPEATQPLSDSELLGFKEFQSVIDEAATELDEVLLEVQPPELWHADGVVRFKMLHGDNSESTRIIFFGPKGHHLPPRDVVRTDFVVDKVREVFKRFAKFVSDKVTHRTPIDKQLIAFLDIVECRRQFYYDTVGRFFLLDLHGTDEVNLADQYYQQLSDRLAGAAAGGAAAADSIGPISTANALDHQEILAAAGAQGRLDGPDRLDV